MEHTEETGFAARIAGLATEIRDNPQARGEVADAIELIAAQIGQPCEDCAAKRQALAEVVQVIATPREPVAVAEPVAAEQVAADAPDAGQDAGQGGTV